MKLQRALTFLDNVTNKLEAVPMRRFAGSTGRCAQGEWLIFLYMWWIMVRDGLWDVWICARYGRKEEGFWL